MRVGPYRRIRPPLGKRLPRTTQSFQPLGYSVLDLARLGSAEPPSRAKRTERDHKHSSISSGSSNSSRHKRLLLVLSLMLYLFRIFCIRRLAPLAIADVIIVDIIVHVDIRCCRYCYVDIITVMLILYVVDVSCCFCDFQTRGQGSAIKNPHQIFVPLDCRSLGMKCSAWDIHRLRV